MFTNPSKIHFNYGKSWCNGQQRTIRKNNQKDPYDSTVSISQGERRKLFITGYNVVYHSGDRSRINFNINAYNQLMRFFTQWKTGITNLSLRLRSRIDEIDPTTNRFGGYCAVISSSQVAWYKQNYKGGTYTALSPATSTISPSLTDGETIGIRYLVYSNLTNTQTNLDLFIARPDQFKHIGSSVDTSPASHVLDEILYQNRSYAHIKLNGTAKDVMYKDMRVWDLSPDYLLRSEKGLVLKSLTTSFDVEVTP